MQPLVLQNSVTYPDSQLHNWLSSRLRNWCRNCLGYASVWNMILVSPGIWRLHTAFSTSSIDCLCLWLQTTFLCGQTWERGHRSHGGVAGTSPDCLCAGPPRCYSPSCVENQQHSTVCWCWHAHTDMHTLTRSNYAELYGFILNYNSMHFPFEELTTERFHVIRCC